MWTRPLALSFECFKTFFALFASLFMHPDPTGDTDPFRVTCHQLCLRTHPDPAGVYVMRAAGLPTGTAER